MDIKTQKCISSNLRYLRDYYGYTQRQLAEILHLSRSAYATIESGRRAPRLDMLLQLSQLFQIRIDVFFEEDLQNFISEVILTSGRDSDTRELARLYQSLSAFSQGCLFEKASQLLSAEKAKKKETE